MKSAVTPLVLTPSFPFRTANYYIIDRWARFGRASCSAARATSIIIIIIVIISCMFIGITKLLLSNCCIIVVIITISADPICPFPKGLAEQDLYYYYYLTI